MSITRQDHEEILAVVNDHIGGLTKSSEMASKAFHPNASINAEPIQKTLYELIDKFGHAKYYTAETNILDTGDKIACVRVFMEIGWLEERHDCNLLGFLLLMKTDDDWKIVNEIYTKNA